MFKRRDIPPVLLLLLLIILVMLTLSQILVVHNGRYGRNIHNMRKLQLELREMDINLHSLMMQNVPSIELNRRMLQNEINAGRIKAILAQASKPESHHRRHRTIHSKRINTMNNGDDASKWRTIPLQNKATAAAKQNVNNTKNVYNMNGRALTKTMYNITHRLNNLLDNVQSERRELHSISEPQTDLTSSSTHMSKSNNISMSTLAQKYSPAGSNPDAASTEDRSLQHGGARENTSIRQLFTPSSQTGNILHYCPSVPPNLKGRVFVNFEHNHNYTEADVIYQNPELQLGGRWRPDPKNCTARHKVAVIIPYRDRLEHLTILLSHIHPILQRQQLDYTVIVVWQY
jgi:hypothetical protein